MSNNRFACVMVAILALTMIGIFAYLIYKNRDNLQSEKTTNDVLHLYVLEKGEVKEYIALDKELQIPGELPSKICPRIGGKIIAHQTVPPELKHIGFVLSSIRLKEFDEQLGIGKETEKK